MCDKNIILRLLLRSTININNKIHIYWEEEYLRYVDFILTRKKG